MKTAREVAEELLCRIYGDDWHECYDVTGHDLLTPTIEIIERDRQEQREACLKSLDWVKNFCMIDVGNRFNNIAKSIMQAGKEEV
jgi:hypothetical protein